MTLKLTRPSEDEYFTEAEAAALLKVKPNTLAIWRMKGKYGPKSLQFFKVGKSVRYAKSAIDAWMLRNRGGAEPTAKAA